MSGGRDLERLADMVGTPSYIYFVEDARQRVAALKNAFEGAFEVSYAVKSNPAHGVLRALLGHADTVDVSSGGEVLRALEAGWSPKTISFTGPGKRESELRLAVTKGIGEVVVESVDEARLLSRIADEHGHRQQILVRIAPTRVPPGFGDTMSGKPVAFGIDEEVLEAALDELVSLPGIELVGFHAYSGTQCLRSDAIAANWAIFKELFLRAAASTGIAPRKLIFGSGIGIPYHAEQTQVDLAAVAEAARPMLAELRDKAPDATLVLETGRYVIGEAGVLLTRVLRTKDSRGTRIGICDAGLNSHLAAAGLFGMLMRRNYRMQNVSAPAATEPAGLVQLSGPLCTSIDVLARNASFSRLEAGDVIAIECSGAYGASASPSEFISHPRVTEWIVDGAEIYDARIPRRDT